MGASHLGFRAAMAVALFVVAASSKATVFTFSDLSGITIPASGTSGISSPYPSTINAAGVTGGVIDVTATLTGLTHTFPGDLDILLVGPGGQKVLLMSDAGGGTDVNNVNLTFSDAAASELTGAPIASGTFRPSNLGAGDAFPAPAPAGPYGSVLSAFDGVDPNGAWSVFVFDDAGVDVGTIASWSLSITATVPEPGTLALLAIAAVGLVWRRRRQ